MVVKNLQVAKEDGKIVIWTKPSSGDQMIPYLDPDNNITVVDFYSGWDYYVPLPGFPQNISVVHTAQAADAGVTFGTTNNSVTAYNLINDTTYNLGPHGGDGTYIPKVMAAFNGVQYPCGAPIATQPQGGRRMVTFYCDTTNVYLYESARPGPLGLPSKTFSYFVSVFIKPGDHPGEPLLDIDPPTRLRMGKGRIDTNGPAPAREVTIGDVNVLDLPTTETIDLSNGRIRMALSNGTVQDIGSPIGTTAYKGTFVLSSSKQITV